jgi:hypothetical protein
MILNFLKPNDDRCNFKNASDLRGVNPNSQIPNSKFQIKKTNPKIYNLQSTIYNLKSKIYNLKSFHLSKKQISV